MDKSIFEVSREEYKSFVNEIKPEFRDIKIEELDTTHIVTKIFSKKTGKCLCSRISYNPKYDDPDPEKYYIFEMPDNEERNPPTPVYKLNLQTKEEVQKFFDFIAAQNKEKKHD